MSVHAWVRQQENHSNTKKSNEMGNVRVLPVHGGRWVVGDVVDESYVSLVQLQRQRVVVLLVQQNTVVFICGHLQGRQWELKKQDITRRIKQSVETLFFHR